MSPRRTPSLARVALTVAAVGVIGSPPSAAEEIRQLPPSPVAERIVNVRGQISRISLFDNRMAVVSFREPGEEATVRMVRLPPDLYAAWVGALEGAFVDGEGTLESTVTSPDSSTAIYLYVGPGAPRTIVLSPVAAIDRHLAQVIGVLDAIQREVLAAPPWFEEVSSWQPRIGDRVRLAPGMTAVVVELEDDDVIVVEHELTSVREFIPPEARMQTVVEILEPKP